jgi:hypothetical protein
MIANGLFFAFILFNDGHIIKYFPKKSVKILLKTPVNRAKRQKIYIPM